LRAQLQPGQQMPGIDNSPVQRSGGYPNVAAAPNVGSMPTIASAVSNPQMPAVIPIPPAWLTIRLPQTGQQVYRIEKPIINIGRQLSNDIIVEDKRVSRYHAQIKYQPDGQFAIFDLGSTNGITINNTPHMRQHVLRNGDRFTIGSYDFNFERR
jgi:pSer/pThr/pTyr-binding forkhead associated (FHA) protein